MYREVLKKINVFRISVQYFSINIHLLKVCTFARIKKYAFFVCTFSYVFQST